MTDVDTLVTELQALEKYYQPNDKIAWELSQKTLVLVVGPACVGKSTIMNELVAIDPRFERVSGPTTRPERPNDEPGMYRYLPHTAETLRVLLTKAKAGELVQYAVHPTTGHVYATELEDYAGEFNCKDVFGHAVQVFRQLPAKTSHTFSVVCDPAEWHERLSKRYPDANDSELISRLKEAGINLAWSLNDADTVWISNDDGELDQAISLVAKYSMAESASDTNTQSSLRIKATQMLGSIEDQSATLLL